MDSVLKSSLWQQFGAAIDMLHDAIRLCPDQLWTAVLWDDPDDAAYGQFWFVAYHTLFWLDLFLTGSKDGFLPPPPFIRGALPGQPYTREQVSEYLIQCKHKVQAMVSALTAEKAGQSLLV